MYRFWLWDVFAGWEESDYGNIAMVRGVFESGFRSFDMNHMPGYYGFSALILWLYDDAVVAAKLAATLSGVGSILGIAWIMKYMAGSIAASLLVLLLTFQPEFSLYSASALREPMYAFFVIGVLISAIKERWWILGGCAALAFLVRFEFPLVCTPLIFLLVYRYGYTILPKIGIPLVVTILVWMIYCWNTYETVAFWSHAASSNIETGMGAEAVSQWDWFVRGLEIISSLLCYVLPSRIGWLIFLGWVLSPFIIPKQSRAWLVLGLSYGAVGVWLLIAFIAQHDSNHNLYWKWMYPLIPLVAFCGVWTWWRCLSNLSTSIRCAVWTVICFITIPMQLVQAQYQIQRADRLYRPQLELALQLEQEVPPDRLILVDNIPACWMNRTIHDRKLISWFDVPVPKNDPQAFADWLEEENVWGVLWFQEKWTQAPIIAPFLQYGGVWIQGKEVLKEESREDGYGWIYYKRVE
ncbi:MAG: hypothetical protein CL916_04675 [Deltaproteobacteria bacterium]|nr:hypothetical protein [Deltaproteobacteria bacterium]